MTQRIVSGIGETESLVITYCSGVKDESPEPMAAIRRYKSGRISQAYDLYGDQLMILSGVYGLLESNSMIPYYDHLLQWEEIEDLSSAVVKTLEIFQPKKVVFLEKVLTQLQYRALIAVSCAGLNIPIEIRELPK